MRNDSDQVYELNDAYVLINDFCAGTLNIRIDPGTETFVGDTLQLKTSGVPNPYKIRWQRSPDNTTWSDVTGGEGNTYPTKPGDADRYFRAKVKAEGYGGEVTSNSRIVKAIPVLTGGVAYTSGYFTVGKSPSGAI